MAFALASAQPAAPLRSARAHARVHARPLGPLAPAALVVRTPLSGALAAPTPSQNVRRSSHVCHVVVRSRAERSDDDIAKVLFSAEQLNEILDELGRTIGSEYHDKDVLILGVLKGGFVFTADLVRHLNPVPKSVQVDFLKAHSYGLGMSTSGNVQLDESFDFSIVKDKHVLVAEDIIDTGLTMSTVVTRLRKAGAMSVRVAVLLDKRARRKVAMQADYVGIQCPDEFVVGYGIDFADRYRWLPYIGVPKPEVVATIKAARLKQLEEERVKLEAQVLARAQEAAGLAASQLLANGHSNGHSNGNANGHANGHSNGHANGHEAVFVGNGVSAKGLLSKMANGHAASSNGHGGSTAVLTRPAKGE